MTYKNYANCNKLEVYRKILSTTARWTKTTIIQRSVGIRDGKKFINEFFNNLLLMNSFWRIKILWNKTLKRPNIPRPWKRWGLRIRRQDVLLKN